MIRQLVSLAYIFPIALLVVLTGGVALPFIVLAAVGMSKCNGGR